MSTCYFLNGTVAPAEFSFVCNPTAGSIGSMCCDGDHNDICSPEGLCYTSNDNVNYFRGTCTDQTWKAPGCIPQCPWYANITPPMTRCGDGTWCCEKVLENGNYQINNTCCSNKQGAQLLPTASLFATITTVTTHVSTSTTTSVQTSTTASVSIHTDGASLNHGSSSANTSLKVGLGVGLGIGIPLVALLAFFLLFVAQRKRRMTTQPSPARETSMVSPLSRDISTRNAVEVPANPYYPSHELATH